MTDRISKANRERIEGEMIAALTPEPNRTGTDVFCKMPRELGITKYDPEQTGRDRKNALRRLQTIGKVVRWTDRRRTFYALAVEEDRVRQLFAFERQQARLESFATQVDQLLAADLPSSLDTGLAKKLVAELHKAGLAIVPASDIRQLHRYLK